MILLWLSPTPGGFAQASQDEVEGRLVQITVDGAYTDVGSSDGLEAGDRGVLMRGTVILGSAEVITVSANSSLLHLEGRSAGERPRVGDVVIFEVRAEDPVSESSESGSVSVSPTVKQDRASGDSFEPLLAPAQARSAHFSEPADLFHGRVWARQTLQVSPGNLFDYSLSRFGTSGSLDRMGGSPWASAWDARVSYRDGEGLRRSEYYQKAWLDFRELSLARRFQDRSFVRLGRFLPFELPSIGYLDGIQGEYVLNEHARLGLAMGLKPDRVSLEVTADEPMAVPYLTLEGGRRGQGYYSSTLGILASMYRGSADRFAVLMDQQADLGSRLSLYSSLEADADVGGAILHDGISLSRWNLNLVSPITSAVMLRAGLDRFESVDTRAERDARAIPPVFYLENGYWRYWVGSSQRLPWNLDLSQDVSWIDGQDADFTPRWRLGIGRRGLFGLKNGRVSLTAYNLEGRTVRGYGGRLDAYLPFGRSRLTLQPSLGFRMFNEQLSSSDLDLTDLALRADYMLNNAWRMDAGLSYSFGDAAEATFVDLGIQYRW